MMRLRPVRGSGRLSSLSSCPLSWLSFCPLSWTASAIAAGLGGGLQGLGNDPPTGAKRLPCGRGQPALRALEMCPPSLNTVLRGAGTRLPWLPPPEAPPLYDL